MADRDRDALTLDDIDEWGRAFQQSRLLLTAVQLDLFTAVAQSSGTCTDIADRMGTEPRATGMLLNAVTALGLLSKRAGVFACTELAARHLVAGAPEDARAPFLHDARLWDRWHHLTECIRTGEPAPDEPTSDDLPRAYIGAMHRYALEQAGAFLAALDLHGVTSVLDLGGGSGAYALTFAERLPEAEVTLFDRGEVIAIAREYISRAGYEHRIATRIGDILEDDFGRGYDLIWLSNVVHGWGEDDVRRGFRRIHGALAPGGRLVLRDFIMNPDKTEPAFGAVFALNMLVSTPRGNSYSIDEYAAWLEEAGFAAQQRIEVPAAGSTAMIEARTSA